MLKLLSDNYQSQINIKQKQILSQAEMERIREKEAIDRNNKIMQLEKKLMGILITFTI